MAVAQRTINQAVDDELSHDVAWWDAISIEALIVHFFHQRWQAYGAPRATFDALLYELRTHGLPQLRNPDCQRRLGDVSKPIGDENKKSMSTGNGPDQIKWEQPKPLPDGLAPVEAFSSDFLPSALAPWVDDIATRLQCPPDYVGVAAITALGSVIGRRIGIKPQRKTDWVEVPNLWGAFIGRPGMLKTPAMREALKPIHRLEAEATKDNEIAWQAYAASINIHKLRRQVADQLAKKQLKNDADACVDFGLGPEPEEPRAVRYRTSDVTYEELGELLIANPSGVLIERDELISLLKHLDRDDQAVARGFYLSGWSGLDPYTFDRIGRGQRHIEAVCVSVLGTTQPVRIS